MLTGKELRDVIKYCPETGEFWWVKRSGPRTAGSIAGGNHSVGCGTYREIRIDGRLYFGHRLAWLYVHDSFPAEGYEIDHIDGDGTNNRLANLRLVTSSGNKQNMPKRSDNKSGIVGVNWHRASGKWMASIGLDGRNKHLGLYSDINEAAAIRKAAEVAHGFHQNHGR